MQAFAISRGRGFGNARYAAQFPLRWVKTMIVAYNVARACYFRGVGEEYLFVDVNLL